MVNFLTRFVPHLKTAELWNLLKKNVTFDMSPHYNVIFDKVMKAMASAKPLALYDTKEDLILEVDASTKGLGACVMQGGKPVSSASKFLSKADSNYSNIECESLAVVFGLQHFKAFCYGRQITIRSNHQLLESIYSKPIAMALPNL